MEEKPRSATMHAVYYGLITGAAMIIFHLILYITDLHMNRSIQYISFLILIGGMIWGTLEFRKLSPNGFMSYGKAFSSCFMIALFAVILSALYTYVFAAFINPGFTQEILDKAREGMENSGRPMTDEQMEQAMAWTERFTTPVMMAIWSFITSLVISAVIALVAAIFLKKEDKSLNATM